MSRRASAWARLPRELRPICRRSLAAILQQATNLSRSHRARPIDQFGAIVLFGERHQIEEFDLESIGDDLQRLDRRPRQALLERGQVSLRAELAFVGELFGEPGLLPLFANAYSNGLRKSGPVSRVERARIRDVRSIAVGIRLRQSHLTGIGATSDVRPRDDRAVGRRAFVDPRPHFQGAPG